MKLLYCIVLVFITVCSCKHKGKNNPNACNGDTRREVKLLTDSKAALVAPVTIYTTIDSLGAIAVPEVKSSTSRLTLEYQTYTVTAKVDKVKKELDGDYHIRLISSANNYLICEVPNANCEYATKCNYLKEYTNVRNFVEGNNLEGKIVTITGVAFVDIDHHYARKQAKNNIELHPILYIKF
jgi:hypothetical protein